MINFWLSLWAIPKLFNYFILTIYMMAAVWWLLQKSYADMLYWVFAAGITAVVTFGYNR